MKFLCLHGKGTSAVIFRSQTASFRFKLDRSFTFDFVDAPFPSPPAAGIEAFYGPPYYAFWHGTAVEDIRASHQWLRDLIERDGPYDGVLLFSQGCSLIASYLLYHHAETPHLPLPFKVAVFICGGIALPVVQNLGVRVSPEAWDWDRRTGRELQVKAAAVAKAQPSINPWARVGGMSFKPIDAAVRPTNVFGLDFTKIPTRLQISIPTVHIYGSQDPRYPASIQLAQFCEPTVRRTYDHGGGHDVPRSRQVSENIATLLKWIALMSNTRPQA